MSQPALLALADGSVFYGQSIAAIGQSIGECVFNTAMTGYQEILTDPSYAEQIVTLTYPHIGNVGCNTEDEESGQVWAKGLVIRDLPLLHSNFRAEQSLSDYLVEKNVIAIADIDTRRLTRILREKGAQNACLQAGSEFIDEAKAIAEAHAFAGLEGLDLAKVVTTKKFYPWQEALWSLDANDSTKESLTDPRHVVVYDFGVKRNILRNLVQAGCRLTVVSAKTSLDEVLALSPDGVFLSNGPGDPAACDYAIAATKELLNAGVPVFGICLGLQILALASGAKTEKMKFGHHGANHPVIDLKTQQVFISSQNHGFMVDENSLPNNLVITHRSLFDNSIQGIRHKDKSAFSFQGHPEASPGPHDLSHLFQQFVELMVHGAVYAEAV